MSNAVLAAIVTLISGYFGMVIGIEVFGDVIAFGCIIAIAVMGAFIICFNEKK